MFKDGQLNIRKVYIAVGYTDLRYNVNGLARIIESEYSLSPFDAGSLFLFCGRKANVVKGLLWEEDGFLLIIKRFEKGHVNWPRTDNDMKELTFKQYHDLLSGLLIEPTIKKVNPSRYG